MKTLSLSQAGHKHAESNNNNDGGRKVYIWIVKGSNWAATVGGERKQTKVWMIKQTIHSRYLAGRQQSVSTTFKSFWHLKVSMCVLCMLTLKKTQVCDRWELISFWWMWISHVVVGWQNCSRRLGLFTRRPNESFNQPLLNRMWGGGKKKKKKKKNPKERNACTHSKNKSSLLSRDDLEANCGTLWCGSTAYINVLIPLTCQSILSLKECTEASFHIGHTPLILLRGLFLQITGCNLQLVKSEEMEKELSGHDTRSKTCDYTFHYFLRLLSHCVVNKMPQINVKYNVFQFLQQSKVNTEKQ